MELKRDLNLLRDWKLLGDWKRPRRSCTVQNLGLDHTANGWVLWLGPRKAVREHRAISYWQQEGIVSNHD